MSTPTWNGPYLSVPVRSLQPGMQSTRARLPKRKATCEEFGCEWFINGYSGVDAGFAFSHPAGVACGDPKRCTPCVSPIDERGANGRLYKRLCNSCLPCKVGTANCPCSDRAKSHYVTDERHAIKYNVATNKTVREVDSSEWHDRTGEGLESLHHIKTRGL